MADVDELVSRWLGAGVIDEAAAERIRQHEHDRAVSREDRPGVFEALIYVGLAVIGVGAFVLVMFVWSELAPWARIVITGVPGVLALVLGQGLQMMGMPGMRRGGSIAWVLGSALLTLCVAVIVYESGWDYPEGLLVPALFAIGITAVLWVVLPWHPQVIALGAAMAFFALSLGVRSDDNNLAIFGGVTAVLSLAWVVLVEVGLLKPAISARPAGALGLALGAYLIGLDDGISLVWELAAFAAGGVLVVLSVARGSFVYMVFGIGVLFLGFVTFTLQRVPDPIVGALVLMLAGVLLVAAVIILARWRPWESLEAHA